VHRLLAGDQLLNVFHVLDIPLDLESCLGDLLFGLILFVFVLPSLSLTAWLKSWFLSCRPGTGSWTSSA
jgi:hypothetical protein